MGKVLYIDNPRHRAFVDTTQQRSRPNVVINMTNKKRLLEYPRTNNAKQNSSIQMTIANPATNIGKQSAKEELQKEQTKSAEKLETLVRNAPHVLIKIKGVWPFDFFQDSLIVDQNKVDLIYRSFLEQETFSMLIKNISGVHIHSDIFFASLRFEVTGYETNPSPLGFLHISEATKARRIILGLIACDKQGVDISQIPATELASKMENIGKAHENTTPLISKK